MNPNAIIFSPRDKYCVVSKDSRLNPHADIFIPHEICKRAIVTNIYPNTVLVNPNAIQNLNRNVRLEQQLSINEIKDTSDLTTLNDIRVKNPNKMILCHLNINSIRNKIDILACLVRGAVDIMLISESKINDSFPTNQFLIPGFSTPYRKDRDGKGGGILLYVRQDIPSKRLNYSHSHCEKKYENLFIEINLYKKKWSIGGS